MIAVLYMLIIQAVLGAIDTIWHHEVTERLAARRAATLELALHSVRALCYGTMFIVVAWFELHGTWAALLAGMLLLEIAVTIADFIIEDRTRQLPATERALHTVMAITFGVLLAWFVPVLLELARLPSAVVGTSYGMLSWVVTLLAVGMLIWFVRDGIAVLRHRRPPQWVRDPLVVGQNANPRTVLVSGATGFVGRHLVRRLVARGDAVIVLARNADKAVSSFGPHVTVITRLGDLSAQQRPDAIVNLAGAPILGWPWTRRRRQQLLASRIETTRALVQLAASLPRPPRVLVSASAIGYYGVSEHDLFDESAGPQAIFQSQLCREWEEVAGAAESCGTRVVRLRFGVVLGSDGGALPQFVRPARFGLAAVLGSGRQWLSWIHIVDLIRLIELAIDTPAVRGAVNAVAPQAVTQRQFQQEITRTLRRPLWLRVPAFALRAALGEMAQLLVDGQRVVPARALALGFVFRHGQLGKALGDLLRPTELRSVTEQPADFYFNGECPVCRLEMSRYERHCNDTGTPMRFIDGTQCGQSLSNYGLRLEHLEQRVYMRDPDGRIISGLPALIELWARMPGYGWLARLFQLPLLHPVATTLYDQAVAPSLAWWARLRARNVATPACAAQQQD